MQIEINQLDDGILEIRLCEDLTAANASDFKEVVQKNIDDENCAEAFLLNFLDLQFLDSSGISALIYLHRKISKASKKLAIVYDNDVVEEVFVLTKLNKIFNLYRDFDEAVDELQ